MRISDWSSDVCSPDLRGPALIGRHGHRGQCLDSWPLANRTLAHLPTLDLEDPLNGVLVHVQQPCHRAIAKRRLFLDQRLDWPRQVRVDLGRRLGWLVVNRPTRHTEPAAQLADRHRKAVVLERSEEHTSELQSLMRISYAVFCLKKKKNN